MTLREKILKTFMVTLREINTHGGPEEFFKKYPVLGMYYMDADGPYDENGLSMGTGMSKEKLAECQKAAPYKLFVCADNAIIDGQKVDCSQNSLGSIDDCELAYEYGKCIGMQMNSNKIDWVLAPSIDMFFTKYMPLMAISNDPVYTAKMYRQVVRGIQDQGVCATVKHFPGLGTDGVNMHLAAGKNILPFDQWMNTYGYTYKEVFKEAPYSVMTTHVALPSYDNEKCDGYLPIATFSKKLTQDLLKGELGFKGAVVTDALIMGGNSTGNWVEESAQAFKAGADVLLWPPVEAADRIEEMLLSGEIPMSRLDDALARIQTMIDFRNNALENGKYDAPEFKYVQNCAQKITENGICCLKNEQNLLPLNPSEIKSVLIVDATSDTDNTSIGYLKAALEKRGIKVDISQGDYDKVSFVCWEPDARRMQEGHDLNIFLLTLDFVSSWNDAYMAIWASHMFDKSKKLIVNYSSPFFAGEYFQEDPTYIEMNCSPSAFSAEALVERLFGEKEFTGKPVLKNN